MNILVTGHLGYIGTVLTGLLKSHGHTVVGLDTGYFEDGIIAGVPVAPDRALRKDIRAVEIQDLEGIDAVVHLAAISDDPMGQLNPKLTDDINHLASVKLAKVAKEAGVSRFVFASSCSMYGAAGGDQALDETASFSPITAYAHSKVDAEAGIRKLASDGFTPTFLRNATAYGASPRIRLGTLVVNNLMGWAITTGKVLIKSDGTPWRPLVHVEDICGACLAVIDAPTADVQNEAFNVGQDTENFQVKDIAEVVRQEVPGAVVEYAEGGQGDKRSYRVSFKKIKTKLPQFSFKWTLNEGVENLHKLFTDIPLTLQMFQDRRFIRLQKLQYLMDSKIVDENLYWISNERS